MKSKKETKLKLMEIVSPKPFRKKKSEPVSLCYLEPGDRFEFIELKRDFKNLFVRRISPTAVSISGEIRENNEGVETWKKLPDNYSVSTGCKVRMV